MKNKFLFLAWRFFLLVSFNNARAATLTSVTMAPATNNVDNLLGQTSATWRFTINNATAISTSTNAVEITFPQITNGDWNFQGVTASSTALGGDLLDFATTSVAVLNTRTLVIVATSTQTSANNNFIIDIKV